MSGSTSPEAETIIRQSETINRLMGQSASRIEQVQRSLDSAYAAQQRFERAQNSINAAAERGRITQERANQLLEMARQRYQSAGQAAETFAAANDNAARSNRGFAGQLGNVGFQVQDFAVQIQGGTSALTAFAQQAPQVAGAFGPGGAILGAVIAVAALTAGILLGKGAADELNKAIEAQEKLYDAATRAAEDYTDGLGKQAREVQQLTDYYQNLNREQREYENRRILAARDDLTRQRSAIGTTADRAVTDLLAQARVQVDVAREAALRAGRRGSSAVIPLEAQEATQAIAEFRAQVAQSGGVTAPILQALATRLDEVAQRAGALEAGAARAGRAIDALIPDAQRLDQQLERNQRQTDALNGSTQSLAASTAAAGAAARAAINPFADLEKQIGDVNARLNALRTGGLDALAAVRAQQEDEARTTQLATQAREAYARRLRETDGITQQQAEEQARARQSEFEERAREQARLERQLTDEQKAAEERRREEDRKRREAELAGRRAARQAERDARKDERDAERAAKDRDRLIAGLDEEAAANLRLEDTLRRIAEAREKAGLSAERAAQLEAQARMRHGEEIARLNEKGNKTLDGMKDLESTSRELGFALSNAFESAVENGAKFSDVLKQIERDIVRLLTRMLVTRPLEQFLGNQFAGFMGGGSQAAGLLGSLFGSGATQEAVGNGLTGIAKAATAAVLHDGGVAGIDGGSRTVPMAAFAGAPRYHTGGFAGAMPFASDEVPAILRRGEVVLTERQQKAVRASGGITLNQTIVARDPNAFRASQAQIGRDGLRALRRGQRTA